MFLFSDLFESIWQKNGRLGQLDDGCDKIVNDNGCDKIVNDNGCDKIVNNDGCDKIGTSDSCSSGEKNDSIQIKVCTFKNIKKQNMGVDRLKSENMLVNQSRKIQRLVVDRTQSCLKKDNEGLQDNGVIEYADFQKLIQ